MAMFCALASGPGFRKIFDDREQEWELSEDRDRSPIPEKLRWPNWAADERGLATDFARIRSRTVRQTCSG